jgi:hypothetical protein
MTAAADAAWRAANVASLELGRSWLGTEHLLLGLLAGPATDPAVAALAEHGVTAEAVRTALDEVPTPGVRSRLTRGRPRSLRRRRPRGSAVGGGRAERGPSASHSHAASLLMGGVGEG